MQEYTNRDPNAARATPGNIVKEYTVEETDTLADIGRKHNMSWDEIEAANRDVVDDPDFVKPGFKLKIPNTQRL